MAEAAKLLGDTANRGPQEAQQAIINPVPIRLAGALAATTAIGASTTAFERVQIGGVSKIYVLVKLSAQAGGNTTVNGYPMLSDANGDDDTSGTRKPITLPTALTIANTTAQEMTFTGKGEEFIDIEISNPGGVTCTVEYVEVYGI